MLTVEGHAKRVCSGLTRREALQAGGAGLFGLSLPQVLAAEELQLITFYGYKTTGLTTVR